MNFISNILYCSCIALILFVAIDIFLHKYQAHLKFHYENHKQSIFWFFNCDTARRWEPSRKRERSVADLDDTFVQTWVWWRSVA